MKKIIFAVLVFMSQFVFGLELTDIDLYRSFEKDELILLINLLEKEQIRKDNNDVLVYINMAKEVLREKNVNVFNFSGLSNFSREKYINQSRTYNNSRIMLNASRVVNYFVYIDDFDGYLKTMDGRKVGHQNGTFLVFDSFNKKEAYKTDSSEYSTIDIYEKSIKKPDFNRFTLDSNKVPFVYISSLQKQIYENDIEKLSKQDLIFLFYELFPVSKLKNFRDWYEFGFLGIKKEIINLYKKEISYISIIN